MKRGRTFQRQREVRIFIEKVVTICSGQREEEDRAKKGICVSSWEVAREKHLLHEAAANAVVLGKDGNVMTSGQPTALALGDDEDEERLRQKTWRKSRGTVIRGK